MSVGSVLYLFINDILPQCNVKPVEQADYSRLSNSMVTFEVIHLHGLKLSCSQQFHVLCLDARELWPCVCMALVERV